MIQASDDSKTDLAMLYIDPSGENKDQVAVISYDSKTKTVEYRDEITYKSNLPVHPDISQRLKNATIDELPSSIYLDGPLTKNLKDISDKVLIIGGGSNHNQIGSDLIMRSIKERKKQDSNQHFTFKEIDSMNQFFTKTEVAGEDMNDACQDGGNVFDETIRYGNNKAHRTKTQRQIKAKMAKLSKRRNRK